jgi:hypothetical protein
MWRSEQSNHTVAAEIRLQGVENEVDRRDRWFGRQRERI